MNSASPSPGRGRLRFGQFDYAASLLAIPVVLVVMADDLHFPLLEGGMATGGSFQIVRSLAMWAPMVFAGFAAARWGNRRSIGVAVGTMGVGLLLYAAAPTCLLGLPALLLADLWEGVVEGFGTPFVQDMHRDDPGRYVNFTHGFWSLGTFAFALHAGALPPGAVTPLLFLLFFLSGVGSSPFWPSIQSLCVDRLPQLDSTLAFIVLSCAGVQLSYLAMVALVIASAPAHPRTRWRNALSPNCATC